MGLLMQDRGAIMRTIVLWAVFGFAGALLHGGAPAGSHVPGNRGSRATASFVAPAVDLRLGTGASGRSGACRVQMHQRSDEEVVDAAVSVDSLGNLDEHTGGATETTGARQAEHDMGREDVMMSSRRSAIAVGLGLLFGDSTHHGSVLKLS